MIRNSMLGLSLLILSTTSAFAAAPAKHHVKVTHQLADASTPAPDADASGTKAPKAKKGAHKTKAPKADNAKEMKGTTPAADTATTPAPASK